MQEDCSWKKVLVIVMVWLFLCGFLLIGIWFDWITVGKLLGFVISYFSGENSWYHGLRVNKNEWVIGFFHPCCDAGGGGERVLWAAISITQYRYPGAVCVVYMDQASAGQKAESISHVKQKLASKIGRSFDIDLDWQYIEIVPLRWTKFMLHTTWPRFTLLGQTVGSFIVGAEALYKRVPHVLIDTFGCVGVTALCGWLYPHVKTAAYVHYPIISTDMLNNLQHSTGKTDRINIVIAQYIKRVYWKMFAKLYGLLAGNIYLVMANSSWTLEHLKQLWEPWRKVRSYRKRQISGIQVVFPPVSVEKIEEHCQVDPISERELRQPVMVYTAQFRREKNHELIIQAFARMSHSVCTPENELGKVWPLYKESFSCSVHTCDTITDVSKHPPLHRMPRLLLIGSVRNNEDIQRINELKEIVRSLGIHDKVDFLTNLSWVEILQYLNTSHVGLNAMWNEHFGISVVEYQAAGLIAIVNDSGGPAIDIVCDTDERYNKTTQAFKIVSTGYRASTISGYVEAMTKAIQLPAKERLEIREKARQSAKRFSMRAFTKEWVSALEKLMGEPASSIN